MVRIATRRAMSRQLAMLFACFLAYWSTPFVVDAWSATSLAVLKSCCRHRKRRARLLHAQQEPDDENKGGSVATQTPAPARRQADDDAAEWQDEDAGAGVVGAQFFGGNKQKEEFYDPVAEARASNLAFDATTTTASAPASAATFDRFADRTAFDTAEAAQLAASYQDFLNGVSVDGGGSHALATAGDASLFSPSLQWSSPLASAAASSSDNNRTPLDALEEANKFYRRIHVAITSAKTLVEKQDYQLRWEIGLAWPTFWEPAVLLTGTSTVNVKQGSIVKQVDVLDDPDLVGSLARQIVPRFWDVYHIGMTPTAEVSPAWERRGGGGLLTKSFVLYDVPSRWTWVPTLLDDGDRLDANASFLPNHAFTTAIRTMGPSKDAHVPTTPTQIEIRPSSAGPNLVRWKIPLTVQLQAQREWPLFQPQTETETTTETKPTTPPAASNDDAEADAEPQAGADDDGDDDDDTAKSDMTASTAPESESSKSEPEDTTTTGGSYMWQPARRVATLPTGMARPQDEGITEFRKRLYERVTAAGLKPKLDVNGRPCFFFWSASTKTCFTDKGLGMAVYEYRPEFAQSNHVGMELEETPELSQGN